MSRPLRMSARLGIALGLTLCIPGWNAEAGSAGRDFSRCSRACQAVRLACQDRCASDCAELYPDDYDACLAACDQVCVTQTQDCRSVCQNIYMSTGPTHEFSFLDQPSVDDVAPDALFEWFNRIGSLSPSGYILVEIEREPGYVTSYCSERPDFYRDSYLNHAATGGFEMSGDWAKWYRSPDGYWSGWFTAGNPNYYGSQCSAPYSWCVEWGFGSLYLWTDPAATQECEVSDVSDGCGPGGILRIRVGSSRSSVCGF